MSDEFITSLNLMEPRYTQREALDVAEIKAPTLQTWVNRGHIVLTEQNPGMGKRRRYSATDIAKLAIMGKFDTLSIPVTVSKLFAEDAVEMLNRQGVSWTFAVSLTPTQMNFALSTISAPPLMKWGGDDDLASIGERWQLISELIGHGIRKLLRREEPSRYILSDPSYDPATPDEWRAFVLATPLDRMTAHLPVIEPAIVVPAGYIINRTLVLLEQFEEAE